MSATQLFSTPPRLPQAALNACKAARKALMDFAMILELEDGRIWRDRRYYAEPFEAPEWRAAWVERVEF